MAFPSDASPTAIPEGRTSAAHSMDLLDRAGFSAAVVSPMTHLEFDVERPAGVSSKRLTQLRSASSQQSEDRGHGPRGPTACVGAALRDNVNEILRPAVVPRASSPGAAALDRMRVDDYAGMRSDGINELRAPVHRRCPEGGKRRGLMTNNESVFVSDVLGQHGRPINGASQFQDPRVTDYLQQQCKPKSRSLQRYYGPEELHKAFCTKFEVVDKTSGRTEIMTARRPGSAAAVVSLCDFDAYIPRPHKYTSCQKQISNIENTPLGLMPRKGAEAPHKPYFTQTAADICKKQSQLRCQDSWLAPGDGARTMRHLGQSKRHVALAWHDRPTSHIIYHQPPPVHSPLVCQADHARSSAL
uniref:Microtubule associated protein SPM2 n=1 Tax=Neospora caninum (strain Liverpool) TaxID=572307 RepID=A0A0F7U704_NEOCL|nr:TPA: microtubule associated protein SPM2 [Neospora caninum Liverpool]